MKNNFSEWQQSLSKRHPLVCQVCTRVISGLVVATIIAWWGINNIPPKPVETIVPAKTQDSSEINISNEGILPANVNYSVVSPDTATINTEVQEGGQYVFIEDTKDKNIKLLRVNNLPLNKTIKINVIGSDSVELKSPNKYQYQEIIPTLKEE